MQEEYANDIPTDDIQTSRKYITSGVKDLKLSQKEPTPQQLRKIQKDKRRKQYEDIQVQNTNNSSIVSKRSVEMIYKDVCPPGEWFKHFVPKGKRRSPAINRGYWIRMESIRQLIFRIIDQHPDCVVNVINLGCGFDPLPFQILKMQKDYKNINFYDIDYPELVKTKEQMILKSSEIQALLGVQRPKSESSGLGWVLDYPQYKLVGCDLKNHQLYQQQLQHIPQGDGIINIFVAEVSLAYMHFDDANKIIFHSSKVANGHFVILEQIIPSGDQEAFTKKMLHHFRKLRSSLKCVEQYPTAHHQYERFKQYYPEVEIQNLFENWNLLVSEETKIRIADIEDFDEWEEFMLFCQHYIITHATNTKTLVYKEADKEGGRVVEERTLLDIIVDKDSNVEPKELNMVVSDIPQLEVKFAASCVLKGDVYTVGGLHQTRTNDTYKNGVLVACKNQQEVLGRMCHSFTAVSEELGLLIGGRTKPGHLLNDIYLFNAEDHSWTKMGHLPYGVSRHEAVAINKEEVLIIGGQSTQSSACMVYNWKTNQVTHKPAGPTGTTNISCLLSPGVCFRDGVGYIVGGMKQHHQPTISDSLVRFKVTPEGLEYEVISQSSWFQRVNCKLEMIHTDGTKGTDTDGTKGTDTAAVLMIGGIDYNRHLGPEEMILQVNIKPAVAIFPRRIKPWDSSPLLVGHTTVRRTDSGTDVVDIVGGGVVCYSFGTAYSPSYRIS